MKIGIYYTEDFSEGGGVHKQTADTYEFDDATDTIEFTQTETDYALATDRAVTLSVHDGVTFIPVGSDDNQQGLESITISPAITTTPALDSLFPIYYEDLTDEEKQTYKQIAVTVPDLAFSVGDEYAITLEATDGWGIASGEDPYTQSITVTATAALADNYVVILVDDVYVGCLEDEEKYFGFRFSAAYEQK